MPALATCMSRLGSAALVVAGSLVLAVPAGASRPGDPLASINLNPLRQFFLASPVRGAEQAAAGDVVAGVRTSYSGYFARKTDGEYDIFIDNELLRFDLEAEAGLSERVAVRVALPMMVYTRGFLDPVAEVIDDVVNTPSEDRKAVGSNRYSFEVARRDGQSRDYEVPDGRFGPGDLLVEGRVRLLDEADGWPALSAWGAVEFPTGGSGSARGNGEVDGGLGLVAARDLGPVRLSLGAGLLFVGVPDELEGLGLTTDPALEGHLGLGWSPDPAWDLVAQLDYGQTPYDGSELPIFERDALELGVGLRWRGERVDVEFVFVEDLIAGASTDYTLVLNLFFGFESVF